jgi:hypothetical protein
MELGDDPGLGSLLARYAGVSPGVGVRPTT